MGKQMDIVVMIEDSWALLTLGDNSPNGFLYIEDNDIVGVVNV